MAECSLSIGTRSTPCARARGITISPAATSTSLLARAIVLPARIAARVGRRPITPATATTTVSTLSPVASSTRASIPDSAKTAVLAHPEAGGLRVERDAVAPRGEADDADLVGMAGGDVERLGADASGGAEDHDALHRE